MRRCDVPLRLGSGRHPGIERLEKAVDRRAATWSSSTRSTASWTPTRRHHLHGAPRLRGVGLHVAAEVAAAAAHLRRRALGPHRPDGSRRLINDIVLVEESDELATASSATSSSTWSGMQRGRRRHRRDRPVLDLLRAGAAGARRADAGRGARAGRPSSPRPPGRSSSTHPVHCQAAAFAFGREDLIPEMFDQVVEVNDRAAGSPPSSTTWSATSRSTASSTPRWPCRCSPTCAATTSPSGTSARPDREHRADRPGRLWDGIVQAVENLPRPS